MGARGKGKINFSLKTAAQQTAQRLKLKEKRPKEILETTRLRNVQGLS